MKEIDRFLLISGAIIPLVFWLTTILSGIILGNYDHLTMRVSDLGAIGTPTRYIFTAGLVLCSVMSLGFIYAMVRVCMKIGLGTIPVYTLLFFTVSIGGAGLVPLPLPLHGLVGIPSTLLFLSPLSALFLWQRKLNHPGFVPVTIIVLLVMISGFMAFSAGILAEYPGLKQRIFHVGWTTWFIYLSYLFLTVSKEPESGKQI
jgi:hypothetical membrane protein